MKQAMEKELAENVHRTGIWETIFNQLGLTDNRRPNWFRNLGLI